MGDDPCSDGSSSLTRSSVIVDPGGDRKERACDSLIMCIVTTLNQGLRNGGGIGDILRAPSSQVRVNSDFIFQSFHQLIFVHDNRPTSIEINRTCQRRD